MKKFLRTVLAVLFLLAQFDIRMVQAQFVPSLNLVTMPVVTLNAPVAVLTSVATTINQAPLSFEHTITTNTLILSADKNIYSQTRAYQFNFLLESKKPHIGKFCLGCVDPNTAELLTVNYSDATPDVTFTDLPPISGPLEGTTKM